MLGEGRGCMRSVGALSLAFILRDPLEVAFCLQYLFPKSRPSGGTRSCHSEGFVDDFFCHVDLKKVQDHGIVSRGSKADAMP